MTYLFLTFIGLDMGGGRNNLAPSGVGAGLVGHIPPAGMPPHHYRLMPQFVSLNMIIIKSYKSN